MELKEIETGAFWCQPQSVQMNLEAGVAKQSLATDLFDGIVFFQNKSRGIAQPWKL